MFDLLNLWLQCVYTFLEYRSHLNFSKLPCFIAYQRIYDFAICIDTSDFAEEKCIND